MGCNKRGAMAASVMMKPSVVAIRGWIMPLPLVMPAMCTTPVRNGTSPKAIFGTWSVVSMARAASGKPSSDKRSNRRGRASTMSLESSSTPITPVEAGSTPATGVLRSFATARQEASATRPPERVAQLALPAFTRMARATPRDTRRCSRASTTGAACTRFRVNIAAADAGVSERIRARSSFFSFRMPA